MRTYEGYELCKVNNVNVVRTYVAFNLFNNAESINSTLPPNLSAISIVGRLQILYKLYVINLYVTDEKRDTTIYVYFIICYEQPFFQCKTGVFVCTRFWYVNLLSSFDRLILYTYNIVIHYLTWISNDDVLRSFMIRSIHYQK